MTTPARNAPCPCGSGKKYKGCCLVKAAKAARVAKAAAAPPPPVPPPPDPVSARAQLQIEKATAYDCLAQIQSWQQRLAAINARIEQLAPLAKDPS